MNETVQSEVLFHNSLLTKYLYNINYLKSTFGHQRRGFGDGREGLPVIVAKFMKILNDNVGKSLKAILQAGNH